MKTVIEMAREAGIRDCTCNGTKGCLERFAELVRADEREACAKFIEDEYVRQFVNPWREDLAAAIRARSNT